MIRARVTATEMLHGELRPPFAVSSLAWTRFVHALTINDGSTRKVTAVSRAGELGCFAMQPRRLVDLGVLKGVLVVKGKAFADPKDKGLVAFLSNPIAQYKALVTSLKLYDFFLRMCPLPAGMSRSGMLALHHRLGPQAFVKWQQHQEPSTVALFQRANGLF